MWHSHSLLDVFAKRDPIQRAHTLRLDRVRGERDLRVLVLPDVGDDCRITSKRDPFLVGKSSSTPEVVTNYSVEFCRVRRLTDARQMMETELVIKSVQERSRDPA